MADAKEMTLHDQQAQTDEPRPGVRLGLPAEGPGSVAGGGRRMAGLLIDIVASYVVAALFVHKSQGGIPTPGAWASLVFLLESAILISVAGQSIGMFAVHLRVISRTGGLIKPYQALLRAVLLLLLIPALVWDADRRGLHDKAAGAIVVNAPSA
jgi:uncharacterized RDD family membrane protein YckC